MSENTPLISIVIPTYNGAKFIGETLSSILASTYKNFEVLCVDDMSSDDTVNIIKYVAKIDGRVKLIALKTKSGNPSKSILLARPHCHGDYFFYMSQDDVVSKNLLEKMIETANVTGADMIVPNMIWYYGVLEGDLKGIFPIKTLEVSTVTGKEAFLALCKKQIHGFALKRMELIDKYKYDDKFIDSTDICTAMQYFYSRNVAFCDAVFYYRQNNPDAMTKKVDINLLKMLDSRIELINFALQNNLKKTEVKYVANTFLMLVKFIYKKCSNSCLYSHDFQNKFKLCLRQFRILMLHNCQFVAFMRSFFVKRRIKRFLKSFYKKD